MLATGGSLALFGPEDGQWLVAHDGTVDRSTSQGDPDSGGFVFGRGDSHFKAFQNLQASGNCASAWKPWVSTYSGTRPTFVAAAGGRLPGLPHSMSKDVLHGHRGAQSRGSQPPAVSTLCCKNSSIGHAQGTPSLSALSGSLPHSLGLNWRAANAARPDPRDTLQKCRCAWMMKPGLPLLVLLVVPARSASGRRPELPKLRKPKLGTTPATKLTSWCPANASSAFLGSHCRRH